MSKNYKEILLNQKFYHIDAAPNPTANEYYYLSKEHTLLDLARHRVIRRIPLHRPAGKAQTLRELYLGLKATEAINYQQYQQYYKLITETLAHNAEHLKQYAQMKFATRTIRAELLHWKRTKLLQCKDLAESICKLATPERVTKVFTDPAFQDRLALNAHLYGIEPPKPHRIYFKETQIIPALDGYSKYDVFASPAEPAPPKYSVDDYRHAPRAAVYCKRYTEVYLEEDYIFQLLTVLMYACLEKTDPDTNWRDQPEFENEDDLPSLQTAWIDYLNQADLQ